MKAIHIALALAFAICAPAAFAQKSVQKQVKTATKTYEKEGWKVQPSVSAIAVQQEKLITMQQEVDADELPKYIWGSAMAFGKTYNAAKAAAQQRCREDILGQIETEVATFVDAENSNTELGFEDAESVDKVVQRSKMRAKQQLGRIITVVEMYRLVSGKGYQVSISVAYPSVKAKEVARRAVVEELKAEGKELGKKLDESLGW